MKTLLMIAIGLVAVFVLLWCNYDFAAMYVALVTIGVSVFYTLANTPHGETNADVN